MKVIRCCRQRRVVRPPLPQRRNLTGGPRSVFGKTTIVPRCCAIDSRCRRIDHTTQNHPGRSGSHQTWPRPRRRPSRNLEAQESSRPWPVIGIHKTICASMHVCFAEIPGFANRSRLFRGTRDDRQTTCSAGHFIGRSDDFRLLAVYGSRPPPHHANDHTRVDRTCYQQRVQQAGKCR